MANCNTCMRVHGRDTNTPIQCPVCRRSVGCFWHNQGHAHIRDCRDGLVTKKAVWDKDRFKSFFDGKIDGIED